MDPSPPLLAAQANNASNAKALYRAAVTGLTAIGLAAIAVLAILMIGVLVLAVRGAHGAPPRGHYVSAGPQASGGLRGAEGPQSASLMRRAAWDIFQLNPCCTPWARFGDAPPGSYLAGAPSYGAKEGFCSGYSDNMWGGASERENFSPDAPGACSGASCAMQKDAAAARLEEGALAVAGGRI